MFGLRQKLWLGFGGLLVIVLLIGVQGILEITELGQSIDVILRENYRSVIACQEMKEALERIDSGALFTLLGYENEGTELITDHLGRFEKALRVEGDNITLPGENQAFEELSTLHTQYKSALQDVQNKTESLENRRTVYFTKLLPLLQEVKNTADHILRINQQNMSDANTEARRKAAQARQQMYLLLSLGTGIAITFMFFTGRWILRPITRLIGSANEIRQGNLDLVVTNDSTDEIGQLSRAFNAMAASLREFRRSNRAKMVRIQHATQQAFNSLPDAIAVIDVEGNVEVATQTARDTFGLKPDVSLRNLHYPWMTNLCEEAVRTGRVAQHNDENAVIQHFVQGNERFFHPKAVPILDTEGQATGVIFLLQDVTQLRQQDELKRGFISTVSHQLKSPLTSIRMAIYLLLQEIVGALTPKQQELLLAARDDSDRLHGIIEDLLDISRIGSGRVQMECRAVAPDLIVLEAAEPFKSAAQDRGVLFVTELPPGLPEAWADTTRINHVFANLFSNALKYTSPGGTITVSARADEEFVWFSVADTGKGIREQYLPRVFDQFFRVPEKGPSTGAGLGLAIAKEIVDAHGGVMQVESREGKGSVFTFSLRRADGIVPQGTAATERHE